MKRINETIVKRSKSKNFKVWHFESWNNISGYNNYYYLTDYNNTFIRKLWNFEDYKKFI